MATRTTGAGPTAGPRARDKQAYLAAHPAPRACWGLFPSRDFLVALCVILILTDAFDLYTCITVMMRGSIAGEKLPFWGNITQITRAETSAALSVYGVVTTGMDIVCMVLVVLAVFSESADGLTCSLCGYATTLLLEVAYVIWSITVSSLLAATDVRAPVPRLFPLLAPLASSPAAPPLPPHPRHPPPNPTAPQKLSALDTFFLFAWSTLPYAVLFLFRLYGVFQLQAAGARTLRAPTTAPDPEPATRPLPALDAPRPASRMRRSTASGSVASMSGLASRASAANSSASVTEGAPRALSRLDQHGTVAAESSSLAASTLRPPVPHTCHTRARAYSRHAHAATFHR